MTRRVFGFTRRAFFKMGGGSVTIMTHLKPKNRPGGGGIIVPQSKPTRLATGMTARSIGDAKGGLRAVIDAVVIDFHWRDFHTGMGAFDTTFRNQLRADLDWCANNTGTSGRPLAVRMRPRLGMFAPTWVKTLTGEMPWYSQEGPAGGATAPSDPRWRLLDDTVPMWWTTAYKDAARDLYNIIATQFGNHPALAEVVMGWPTTQYAEPCLKQLGNLENFTAAVTAGYTDTLDDACFQAGWQAHKDLLSPLDIACYTAYNPPGKVDHTIPKFTFGNVGRAIRLMEAQMALLGPFAILANNSLSGPVTGGSQYGTMYDRMRAARDTGTPITFQSETLAKHINDYPAETVQNTVETAVAWRATTLELPIGCQNFNALYPENWITPAFAAIVNPQFYANATDLTA